MGFKSSSASSLEPLEDLEASSEVKGSLLCESGNLEETGPFAAADKRLLSLEEKLNFSKVFLMVKCFPKVAATRGTAERVGVGTFRCSAQCLNVLLFPKGRTVAWRGSPRKTAASRRSAEGGASLPAHPSNVRGVPSENRLNHPGAWGILLQLPPIRSVHDD